jgi:hypothetical protein
MPSPFHGMHETPADCATSVEPILSPRMRITSDDGPMNVTATQRNGGTAGVQRSHGTYATAHGRRHHDRSLVRLCSPQRAGAAWPGEAV